MIILEHTFLKSQIYDKLVTMLLSYHFSVLKGLFQPLKMQAFSITKIHEHVHIIYINSHI